MIVRVIINSYSLSTVRAENRSFQSHLKPERHYASRQLSELTIVASRATKILSTVANEIPIDRSFQSYQNQVNNGI